MNSGFIQQLMPYLKLALAMIIVGSSVAAGKLMVEVLPVMLSSCLRFAIASPILLFLLYWFERPLKFPDLKDVFTLFLQSLTGVFLFSVFLLYGLKYSNAVEAGLITGTLPAVTSLLAVLFLKDKLNACQMIGIACTIAGASLLNIMGGEPSTTGSFSLMGACLIFGAVVCEALFVVIGKRASGKLSALTIATSVSIFGFILFLPFALWDLYNTRLSQTTILDWSLVIYFALAVTVGAFWLFYSGLSKVPASIAGGFMAFIPLSALFLSFLVLGEPIRGLHLMAGFCVILGIILLSLVPKSTLQPKSDSKVEV